MSTVTVNVSFPKQLLTTMDRVARREARTRSELLREAVRMYVESKERWARLFESGDDRVRALGLKPEAVEALIAQYRLERRVVHPS